MKPIQSQQGFSAVEFLVTIFVFAIMGIGLVNAYTSVQKTYSLARQLNEVYAVLSACPEIDRALEFNSISSATNCFPNNAFSAEDGVASTVTYNPVLTVTDATSLPASDPLTSIPDSKIINISVPISNTGVGSDPYRLRMLITRNGVGQL